ncbi:BTB/POZ and MATH domain-containing protein 3 [Sorghum bicolor]|uniref:BTB/POZ and MATH domain-containing protein 3 n=1 Tax=Sorghum bicolor TaxID=4558 RepID=UPI000B424E30|nr:BTB/POZ and MATH domain-containing protein 3 [Sorghum bicolor]|eukprot:XP_021321247.1 BTB/POZ and MATH domain-containing protein 3 [Sorghum bicolor]
MGRYDWAVRFFPDGGEGGALVLLLELLTKDVAKAWSPVFKAKFYGPEMEENLGCIAVEDVRPAVLKAMLHFIYTDSLPDMDALGDVDKQEMIRHLLVIADQYEMKRLKLMCEDSLCNSLSVDSV